MEKTPQEMLKVYVHSKKSNGIAEIVNAKEEDVPECAPAGMGVASQKLCNHTKQCK